MKERGPREKGILWFIARMAPIGLLINLAWFGIANLFVKAEMGVAAFLWVFLFPAVFWSISSLDEEKEKKGEEE